MNKRVLVIGGYGNFGSFITKKLAQDDNIQVIVAGRSSDKANKLISELDSVHKPEAYTLDINIGITEALGAIRPDIVVHTSGPFQAQGYGVAEACIEYGCHYIDLADGRVFVSGITKLNTKAQEKNILVVSGASSVPCLTSALVEHYRKEFKTLEDLDYGITTAQKTTRGLATTSAILSYTGKPFKTLLNGEMKKVFGWQNLHLRKYRELGWRFLGNCEVPDLNLFPRYYPELKNVRFYAGLEIPFIHIALWMMSWLVRIGFIRRLEKAAPLMLKTSYLFDWLGSANSGFHMQLSGNGHDDNYKTITFELTACSGDGPYIPCVPAILLAKNLARDEVKQTGAHPCIGFVSRDEYLAALSNLDITWQEYSS
ncbi:saccharopine dehydrogenase family protein [Pelagibius sp. Alg239-R121]|uniref:saccharopine dehydrogenase family protein n=1 Tax=Pelagibius sp. Alg239-R121 TaxID=2993448 RepID=UPI0024A6AE23|nr:saccharopine dehydrogenase NADP-binding domain-containing protein [Pelagibius sp. Alg239-R121]